jgi:hypothetical protein
VTPSPTIPCCLRVCFKLSGDDPCCMVMRDPDLEGNSALIICRSWRPVFSSGDFSPGQKLPQIVIQSSNFFWSPIREFGDHPLQPGNVDARPKPSLSKIKTAQSTGHLGHHGPLGHLANQLSTSVFLILLNIHSCS